MLKIRHNQEKLPNQLKLYRDALKRSQPVRILYLAISDEVYLDFFQEEIAQMVVENHQIKLIIFDAKKVEVFKWIK